MYICGKASMATDVRATIEAAVSSMNQMSGTEAKDWVDTLKRRGKHMFGGRPVYQKKFPLCCSDEMTIMEFRSGRSIVLPLLLSFCQYEVHHHQVYAFSKLRRFEYMFSHSTSHNTSHNIFGVRHYAQKRVFRRLPSSGRSSYSPRFIDSRHLWT
jgi:hypothetical protein